MSVLGAMLFVQTQQCSATAAASAGALSSLLSSLPAMFGRIAFKQSRPPRTLRAYRHHQAKIKQLFAVGAVRTAAKDAPEPPPSPPAGEQTPSSTTERHSAACKLSARASAASRRSTRRASEVKAAERSSCGEKGSSTNPVPPSAQPLCFSARLGGTEEEMLGDLPRTASKMIGGLEPPSTPQPASPRRPQLKPLQPLRLPQLERGVSSRFFSSPRKTHRRPWRLPRGCRAAAAHEGAEGGDKTVELHSSQLVLRPDGFSLALQLKSDVRCCVPATRVGTQHPFQSRLAVAYDPASLPACCKGSLR